MNIFDKADREALLARVIGFNETNIRQWGKMNHNEMLCHTTDQIRCVLGEKEFKHMDPGIPLWLLKFFIFFMPWPKNSPTHPDFDKARRGTQPHNFEEDKNELLRVIKKVGDWPKETSLPPHPSFGHLSRKRWGQLMADHLDWHLKQFNA